MVEFFEGKKHDEQLEAELRRDILGQGGALESQSGIAPHVEYQMSGSTVQKVHDRRMPFGVDDGLKGDQGNQNRKGTVQGGEGYSNRKNTERIRGMQPVFWKK